MKHFAIVILILTMGINLATYIEIKEISLKMDGFQTIEVEEPALLRLIKGAIKWLI